MTRLYLRGHVLLLPVVLLLAACPNSCRQASQTTSEDEVSARQVADEHQGASGGSHHEGHRVVQIATGEEHTVLLTADGSVWTCGNGGDGQLGWEQTEVCQWGVRVDGLPSIVDVTAGTGYSIFLAEDGSVWGAGYGFDERLGPTESRRFTDAVELGIDGLVDVAAFTNYTLGRRADGSVVAFGVNDAGGLGHGSLANSATPVETGVVAVEIDAGGSYALALTANGQVKSWGANNYGTLCNASVPTMSMTGSVKAVAQAFFSLTPVDVEIDRVISISAGTEHALVVRDDGTVWGCGRNITHSLLQPRDNTLYPTPVRLPGLSDVVAVAAGNGYGLALTGDGSVLAWGNNSNGRLGHSGPHSPAPTEVAGLPPIANIIAGKMHAFAIDRQGRAWAWGWNQYGQLMTDTEGYTPAPVALGPPV